ncbi:MAG: molybdate ABC transporter substrate-binding protein [Candidatus Binatia bacterium]
MPAELNVLSAGAVKPGLLRVIDGFRRETGGEVRVAFATAPEIRKRLANGETADVLIAPQNIIDELAAAGKSRGDRVTIGRIGVGVMVRAEALAPQIATVKEFRQSLLGAESIVYNQASTGAYVESLFNQLGIARELATRTTRYPDFAGVLDHIGKGRGNEIGLGASTVIIENVSKGVKFIGPLPMEIQNYTTYAATVVARAETNDAARALVNYLAGSTAKAIFTAAGIE